MRQAYGYWHYQPDSYFIGFSLSDSPLGERLRSNIPTFRFQPTLSRQTTDNFPNFVFLTSNKFERSSRADSEAFKDTKTFTRFSTLKTPLGARSAGPLCFVSDEREEELFDRKQSSRGTGCYSVHLSILQPYFARRSSVLTNSGLVFFSTRHISSRRTLSRRSDFPLQEHF